MAAENSVYLHGDLELHIHEARSLPNMDVFSERLRRCFTACDSCSTSTARDIHDHDKPRIMSSDPYATVSVPQATLARTRVIKSSLHPRWDEHFHIPLAHPVSVLEVQVKDDDLFGSELIGTALFAVRDILSGKRISGWFSLLAPSGNPPKPDTAIRLEMKFTPCDKNPAYRNGIAGGKHGVRHTYFPLRRGGDVRLYQDAHVPNGLLPDIKLDGGMKFEHQKCWEDICYAILEAHHIIYIVGWSVYHKVRLVREPTRHPLPRGGDLNLGELLKYKSQEGVRVLLLVWDDKTSHDKFFINTTGVMMTHDEEIRKFFKHSSVECKLAPRYASSKLGYFKQQVVGTLFTHHQKCILVDTQASGTDRKITAFLGGLDLCDGRYDTPEHRLFRDLNTVFKEDFHQPTFPAGTKAPREPWHDWHCRIDGPAAYDVLINFEQRWRKATKWKEFGLRLRKASRSRWRDDSLVSIERISWILSPPLSTEMDETTIVPEDEPLVWARREDDPENWHVQIFRSIDSGSVKGFPKEIHKVESQNLICTKKLVIDKSIQTAYIQAIRSAKHFIYIENQYFIGSSYAWPSYKFAGADNLIPMELALKIVNKIRADERFAVYVIVPMWPEGDPTTGAMQEILYWQAQTMEMMYGIIARELKSLNITHSQPQDYLNFYCLGKREEMTEEIQLEGNNSSANTNMVSDSYKFRRFMIYVHAKGMIVDDEYIIMGSANINQRSMAGTKDTEIAMGSYQPHHTWANGQPPHGQVYGYRMSLWAEHLGFVEKWFDKPERVECVKKVNEIAVENWKRYTGYEFKELQGHILKYPVHIEADGKVVSLPGYENFPDTGGKVIGTYSNTIPDTLTT